MCVSRSFSQYGVLGICTFDTFYHGYFPGAGLPFLFSFGCIPFYITFHSQKSTPHAFARREGFLPAFLPASCFPLQPEQTPVKGVAGLPTSCRHYGESVPACVLRTRPSEARRFMFYFFTIAFGRSHNHFPPQR